MREQCPFCSLPRRERGSFHHFNPAWGRGLNGIWFRPLTDCASDPHVSLVVSVWQPFPRGLQTVGILPPRPLPLCSHPFVSGPRRRPAGAECHRCLSTNCPGGESTVRRPLPCSDCKSASRGRSWLAEVAPSGDACLPRVQGAAGEPGDVGASGRCCVSCVSLGTKHSTKSTRFVLAPRAC